MKKKKILIDILMIFLFIFGVGAIAYPFVSDSVNNYIDQQIINYYQNKANQENFKEMNKIQAEMEEKNREMAEIGNGAIGVDPFEDIEENLPEKRPSRTFYEENTIGVVTIPGINVRLPIFNQTSPIFLEKGASLLEGTSFPTGGQSTHSVITSHAGLMNAKLFTDLEKMKEGDHFFIEINNRTLAYEVDQIKVVLPTELDDVQIVDGEDFVTLLTCTPYMINTHRLLVRGHRIPYVPDTPNKLDQVVKTQRHKMLMLGTLIIIIALIVIGIFYKTLFAYLISRRTYQLSAQLLDQNDQVLSNVEFSLLNHRGKNILNENQQPRIIKTNEEGVLNIKELLGGKYLLENEELGIVYSMYVKRIKDEYFSVKEKKTSVYRLIGLSEKN